MDYRQRILLVDDDHDMLGLLNNTLELEGFDTVVVASGKLSLSRLKKIDPDLVILDTVKSGPENLQTLNLIRETSDIPVIVLSSEYGLKALWDALSFGADDFVQKPFGTRSFVARIRAKLRRARPELS